MITNADDSINSSDVAERIESLQDELSELHELELVIEESQDELSSLERLQDEGSLSPDESLGIDLDVGILRDRLLIARREEFTIEEYEDELSDLRRLQEDADLDVEQNRIDVLIRDSYFSTYAQQLAENLSLVRDGWPNAHIDWDSAAEELQQDYNYVSFNGVGYWVQNGYSSIIN